MSVGVRKPLLFASLGSSILLPETTWHITTTVNFLVPVKHVAATQIILLYTTRILLWTRLIRMKSGAEFTEVCKDVANWALLNTSDITTSVAIVAATRTQGFTFLKPKYLSLPLLCADKYVGLNNRISNKCATAGSLWYAMLELHSVDKACFNLWTFSPWFSPWEAEQLYSVP